MTGQPPGPNLTEVGTSVGQLVGRPFVRYSASGWGRPSPLRGRARTLEPAANAAVWLGLSGPHDRNGTRRRPVSASAANWLDAAGSGGAYGLGARDNGWRAGSDDGAG